MIVRRESTLIDYYGPFDHGFKILFKIWGHCPCRHFLTSLKTSALFQREPFQNVHCRVAAHRSCNYSSSPVLEGFKVLFVTFPATAPYTYTANYRLFRNVVTKRIRSAKAPYNKRLIEESGGDDRSFWKTMKKILPEEKKAT